MKQIRKRLTYANVMSSLAVFLILGGATAFAAIKKVGANEIKANSIKTGKIVKEAVTAGKIKTGAVTESRLADGAVTNAKIADNAVTTTKIADKAVTGAKINVGTLGTVPNAERVGGQSPSSFVARSELLWAVVNGNGTLAAGSGAVAAEKTSTGRYAVTFNRTITSCSSGGTATDVTGGEPPASTDARIIATDNREQPPIDADKVNVTTTNPAGVQEDPASGDGFTVTVYC